MRNIPMKTARTAKHMTQKDLAEAVGTTRQTINAIEQGDYNPSIRLCRAICEALGRSLDELFGDRPEPALRGIAAFRYCEGCKVGFEGSACPSCGSKAVRQAKADDLCFLAEKDQIWGEMLSDVLRQNDIPFLRKGRMGAGFALAAGPGLERYRFYVSFCDLKQARSAVEQLFGDDYD